MPDSRYGISSLGRMSEQRSMEYYIRTNARGLDREDSNDESPPVIHVHSNVEMGSLDMEEVSLDGKDDPIDRRKHPPLDGSQKRSVSLGSMVSGPPEPKNGPLRSIRVMVFSSKLNVLFPVGLIAIIVDKLTGNRGWVFVLSLLGIIPMAERLGFTTEQLAFYTGPTVGGLLNATFGNATELIISINALKSGMMRVVQQSLLGSILSNMLLVLGCAFFSGGLVIVKREQEFSKGAATVNSSLLLMAVMGLLFPAVLHSTRTERHYGKSELALSRFSSCVMLVAYVAYLYFQLKRQKLLFPAPHEGEAASSISEEEESPELSKWEAGIWLFFITAWIAVLSEYLVDAIEGASSQWNIPIAFISVILLPIVGNAAEHASAIIFAMKDKLDIALGVAIGSSTQIAMFGVPFLVIIGWIIGRPMDLNFQLFETATLFLTVLVVAFMLQEGTSNYFKGLMLIFCYLIIGASFYVHTDSVDSESKH